MYRTQDQDNEIQTNYLFLDDKPTESKKNHTFEIIIKTTIEIGFLDKKEAWQVKTLNHRFLGLTFERGLSWESKNHCYTVENPKKIWENYRYSLKYDPYRDGDEWDTNCVTSDLECMESFRLCMNYICIPVCCPLTLLQSVLCCFSGCAKDAVNYNKVSLRRPIIYTKGVNMELFFKGKQPEERGPKLQVMRL